MNCCCCFLAVFVNFYALQRTKWTKSKIITSQSFRRPEVKQGWLREREKEEERKGKKEREIGREGEREREEGREREREREREKKKKRERERERKKERGLAIAWLASQLAASRACFILLCAINALVRDSTASQRKDNNFCNFHSTTKSGPLLFLPFLSSLSFFFPHFLSSFLFLSSFSSSCPLLVLPPFFSLNTTNT